MVSEIPEVDMTTENFARRDSVAFEALRRVILRSRVAIALDEIIHQPSATRCVTIGRAMQAVAVDPVCEALIRESGLMNCLREEAIARSQGTAEPLPPLLPDPTVRNREGVSNAG